MKRNVLFILSGYPAASSPTDLAAEPVIRDLRRDHNVFCLTRRGAGRPAHETVDGVEIFRVREHLLAGRKGGVCRALTALRFRITQLLTIPLYPKVTPFFERRFCRKARSVCRDKKIDTVISVCFPPEAVAAGYYVKKKLPDIIFVPYMIDAYACGTLPKFLPRSFTAKKLAARERRWIDAADRVIAMPASREFREKTFGDEKTRYLNPAFLSAPPRETEQTDGILEKDRINVLFTGYLYLPDRDPGYVIRALDREDVCLIFVGKDRVGDLWDRVSFKGTLKHIGFMPHEKLAGLLAGADVLLNMGVSNSRAISGKIFEYMAFGKPILTTYFKEDDAALAYLARYPLSCTLDQTRLTAEEAAERFDAFVRETSGKQVPFETVRELFYDSTPEAFTEEIKTLWQGETE